MKVSLKSARVNCGLTLKQAAKAIGCSVSSLSYWENGKVDITLTNVVKLCCLYGVSLEDIQVDYEKNLPCNLPKAKEVIK